MMRGSFRDNEQKEWAVNKIGETSAIGWDYTPLGN